MDVRAAVAFEAGKPLQVETVQLDGPKAGEVLVEIKATGICHTDEFTLSAPIRKGCFRPSWGMRAPASWSRSAPASPRSRPAIM
jgi:S-(hydroxymethyl)glutathione dehydrogenase/alcohol dehydrogenase